jgi:hypothetical protein
VKVVESPFLTMREAAEYLRAKEATVRSGYRVGSDGEMDDPPPRVRVGKKWLFDRLEPGAVDQGPPER